MYDRYREVVRGFREAGFAGVKDPQRAIFRCFLWAFVTLLGLPLVGAIVGYIPSGVTDAAVLAVLGLAAAIFVAIVSMFTGMIADAIRRLKTGASDNRRVGWPHWLVCYGAAMGVILFSGLLAVSWLFSKVMGE